MVVFASLHEQDAPVSNRCGAVGNMLKLQTASGVDLSTYRPSRPSDSSYESVHSAARPEIVISYSRCDRVHTRVVMHSCYRRNTSTYYTGYHLILWGSFRRFLLKSSFLFGTKDVRGITSSKD